MLSQSFSRNFKQVHRAYSTGDLGSVNKVTLLGRVKMDPKIHTNSKTNTQFASFYLTTFDYPYAADGNIPKNFIPTDHRIICSDAKDVEKLTSNSRVYVEGKLKYRSYKDPQTNVEKPITEIFVARGQVIDLSQSGDEPKKNNLNDEDLF